MTITQDKETGIWKARVKAPDGTTKTLSTRETDRTKALAIIKQSRLVDIEILAKAGKLKHAAITAILGKESIVTLKDAVEQFGEWLRLQGRSQLYLDQSIQIMKRLVSKSRLDSEVALIGDLTANHIYNYINDRESESGAAWRATQLGIIRSFYSVVTAKGWIEGNPAMLVRVKMKNLSHQQKETKERRPFTDKEVAQLLSFTLDQITGIKTKLKNLDVTDPNYIIRKWKLSESLNYMQFWRSAVAIGRFTGLRIGDVCQMEWDSLARAGRIIVWTDKRDKRVELPLQPLALMEAVAAIPEADPNYLFPNQRLMYLSSDRRSKLSTDFRRMCVSLGIHGKTFHDLRSSFLSDAHKRGVPIEHIRRSAGHSSVETTKRYIKPMAD